MKIAICLLKRKKLISEFNSLKRRAKEGDSIYGKGSIKRELESFAKKAKSRLNSQDGRADGKEEIKKEMAEVRKEYKKAKESGDEKKG